MKKIITLVAIAVLLIGCGKSKKEAQIQGKVEKEQISIVSKIPGKIVQLLVKEGDLVKKGDTLAILDRSAYMIRCGLRVASLSKSTEADAGNNADYQHRNRT